MSSNLEKADDTTGIGCVLRFSGDEFNVNALLSHITIKPCHVRKKGHPTFGPESRVATYTGFNISTSDASEHDLNTQISDTLTFLQGHENELAYIMSFPGIASAEIDFSVECRVGTRESFIQNKRLPSALLLIAGRLGIDINLSLYPPTSSNTEL
jgi:hypothetical protein